jgi:hypothetical protein
MGELLAFAPAFVVDVVVVVVAFAFVAFALDTVFTFVALAAFVPVVVTLLRAWTKTGRTANLAADL